MHVSVPVACGLGGGGVIRVSLFLFFFGLGGGGTGFIVVEGDTSGYLWSTEGTLYALRAVTTLEPHAVVACQGCSICLEGRETTCTVVWGLHRLS